jgi:hypothetical protein
LRDHEVADLGAAEVVDQRVPVLVEASRGSAVFVKRGGAVEAGEGRGASVGKCAGTQFDDQPQAFGMAAIDERESPW